MAHKGPDPILPKEKIVHVSGLSIFSLLFSYDAFQNTTILGHLKESDAVPNFSYMEQCK